MFLTLLQSSAAPRPDHAAHQVVTGLWGGKRHGSFAGKAASGSVRPAHAAHHIISGLWGGKRHGSFAGKAAAVGGSVKPTHAAHQVVSGLWGGRRHGGFAGKLFDSIVTPTLPQSAYAGSGGGGSVGYRRTTIPDDAAQIAESEIEEQELVTFMYAFLTTRNRRH